MKDTEDKKNIDGAESLVNDVSKVADIKPIKPIKLKQLYKDIKVIKILNLKYAGAYRNYSEFSHPYVYIFFNEISHYLKEIKLIDGCHV